MKNNSVNQVDTYGLVAIEYGGPIDMFLSFLMQPENGGLSADLAQDILSEGLVSDLIDSLHDQAKTSLRCASQGSFGDHIYVSDYRARSNWDWIASGNWQLSYAYRCDWQCGLHTDSACKCCTCRYRCQITGLVSKHYTFFYEQGGNSANLYGPAELAYIAQGLLGSGDYYINQPFSTSFGEGGISHCDQ